MWKNYLLSLVKKIGGKDVPDADASKKGKNVLPPDIGTSEKGQTSEETPLLREQSTVSVEGVETTKVAMPSAEETKKWNNQGHRVSGQTFLRLTEEKLMEDGLKRGPAGAIAGLIETLKGEEQVKLKRKHEESPEDLSEIVKSAVREEFSRQKPANQIPLIDEDFQPLGPVSCQPFTWDVEREEAQQMHNVEVWFKNALNLPRGFHVNDIHTQANYQRHLQRANVVLTGGSDISIGPSGTACVWIEAKKTKEDFKEGQAIGELLLLDNLYSINSMVVLTDCNAHWIIFFFIKVDDEQNMAKCRIHNPGIALAIIKQFVLEEGKKFHSWIGKVVDYNVADLPPLQKKTKFIEHIPGADHEDRMADMIDDMSEQELFNMTARKRLRMLRNWCILDEQPQVDQLIRQFSDDYEKLPPMKFA
ncbi:3476_t:CDS:2 [Acaulospora colombiana]|uniref:3476_t:CDS:1 n=1 Tax=Acaulospora colombiana TaxID=27376 RepID=A0ACA9M6V3_9GLOM|nr:3476_t:CDS:2 [Acaulospora colombiana]